MIFVSLLAPIVAFATNLPSISQAVLPTCQSVLIKADALKHQPTLALDGQSNFTDEHPLVILTRHGVLYSEFFKQIIEAVNKKPTLQFRAEQPHEIRKLDIFQLQDLADRVANEIKVYAQYIPAGTSRQTSDIVSAVQSMTFETLRTYVLLNLLTIAEENQFIFYHKTVLGIEQKAATVYQTTYKALIAGGLLAEAISGWYGIDTGGRYFFPTLGATVLMSLYEDSFLGRFNRKRRARILKNLYHQTARLQTGWQSTLAAPETNTFQRLFQFDKIDSQLEQAVEQTEGSEARTNLLFQVHLVLIKSFSESYLDWILHEQPQIDSLMHTVKSSLEAKTPIDQEAQHSLFRLKQNLSLILVEAENAAQLSNRVLAALEAVKDSDPKSLRLTLLVQRQFQQTLQQITLPHLKQTIEAIESLGQAEAAMLIHQLSGKANDIHSQILMDLYQSLELIRSPEPLVESSE